MATDTDGSQHLEDQQCVVKSRTAPEATQERTDSNEKHTDTNRKKHTKDQEKNTKTQRETGASNTYGRKKRTTRETTDEQHKEGRSEPSNNQTRNDDDNNDNDNDNDDDDDDETTGLQRHGDGSGAAVANWPQQQAKNDIANCSNQQPATSNQPSPAVNPFNDHDHTHDHTHNHEQTDE